MGRDREDPPKTPNAEPHDSVPFKHGGAGRPPAKLDPEYIRTLLESGMTLIEVRKVVRCGHAKLKACIAEHDLPMNDNMQLEAARARRRVAMTAGDGGDELFARLIGRQRFDRIRTTGDGRTPIHIPHSAPGDDRSGCGSSMLHSVGQLL